MEYLIAGLLVALIVAAGVAVMTRRATRHEGGRAASDPEYGGGTAMLAPDRSAPLGDTSEHAGQQREGETVADQDADRSGGSGRSGRTGGYAGTADIGEPGRERPDDDAHVARPVDGGEAEGRRRI